MTTLCVFYFQTALSNIKGRMTGPRRHLYLWQLYKILLYKQLCVYGGGCGAVGDTKFRLYTNRMYVLL